MSFELILPFLRPIEPLIGDDEISEIMCNPDSSCWIERDGLISRAECEPFGSGELHAGLEVIANRFNKRLDSDNPILNVRLPDGSRLSAIIPPVVSPEPLLNIRKFGKRRYSLDQLTAGGMLADAQNQVLRGAVLESKNILISGATGSGKTTLLNALASEIPAEERIFVIEDTAEIRLNQPHVISSETQSNGYTKEISFDALLKAALRHRPDRIVLGEVRGSEARALLDAMNTGHDGTLSTVHASSPDGALRRVAALSTRASTALSASQAEEEVRAAIDVVIQLAKNKGRRQVQAVVMDF